MWGRQTCPHAAAAQVVRAGGWEHGTQPGRTVGWAVGRLPGRGEQLRPEDGGTRRWSFSSVLFPAGSPEPGTVHSPESPVALVRRQRTRRCMWPLHTCFSAQLRLPSWEQPGKVRPWPRAKTIDGSQPGEPVWQREPRGRRVGTRQSTCLNWSQEASGWSEPAWPRLPGLAQFPCLPWGPGCRAGRGPPLCLPSPFSEPNAGALSAAQPSLVAFQPGPSLVALTYSLTAF